MKLSVIIVNYNVKFFLEQCLYSVTKAVTGIDAEVIVVDNNSVDGSSAMIANKFPSVILIENHENVGFSKANNQAIQRSKGEYVLLLNPDTVIEESTLSRCISFMDAYPKAGILGAKMIDGKGRFLPESKRGLPTPEVAFYKIFGMTRLFPHSKKFGRYYLGHTRNDEVQEVEVLTGAFMFIRKEVFGKVGLLDEEYFMYGEDIDFSYRVFKAGYKVVYYPDTTIIHYKGESTRKGSLNYVLIFYKAMQIFARKHFSDKLFKVYSLVIGLAIYLRAAISLMKRFAEKLIPFVSDAVAAYIGIYFLAVWWAGFYFNNPQYYSKDIFYKVLPVFILLFLLSNLLAGGYKSPFNLIRVLKGAGYGFIVALGVYALLPDNFRFSRAMVVMGSCWALISFALIRVLLSSTGIRSYALDEKKKKRLAIVGFEDECLRIREVLSLSGIITKQVINVFPGARISSEFFNGTIHQLKEILEMYRIDEVIFSARDVPSGEIIAYMKNLTGTNVDFKIASPESHSLVGSNSSQYSGDLYIVKVDSLKKL